jgi:hypothetical protein
MDKDLIRAMAKAERMMDKGEIPFVWAPSARGIMERLACTNAIMEEFGLENAQTVNSMIREAILNYNLEQLRQRIEEITDNLGLDSEFDFRKQLDEDEDDNSN